MRTVRLFYFPRFSRSDMHTNRRTDDSLHVIILYSFTQKERIWSSNCIRNTTTTRTQKSSMKMLLILGEGNTFLIRLCAKTNLMSIGLTRSWSVDHSIEINMNFFVKSSPLEQKNVSGWIVNRATITEADLISHYQGLWQYQGSFVIIMRFIFISN